MRPISDRKPPTLPKPRARPKSAVLRNHEARSGPRSLAFRAATTQVGLQQPHMGNVGVSVDPRVRETRSLAKWFTPECCLVRAKRGAPAFSVRPSLAVIEAQMLAAPDQQASLTDPDARSMATSGRGSGVVGYNVQVAVETEHHLIVAHEVTNVGSDRSQLAAMAKQAKAALQAETLDAVADRGYFHGEEILACEQAGIAVTLPKPMTSGAKAEGRFGKQDFVYKPEEDVYRCPAGEKFLVVKHASPITKVVSPVTPREPIWCHQLLQ